MGVSKQLFIEDLLQEQIAVIEERMRPDRFSYAGFLGENQSLREVIEADTKTLERHGITHKQVGGRLDSLMGQAFRQQELGFRVGSKSLQTPKTGYLIDGFLRVFEVAWMGSQSCPWFYETEPEESCGEGSHDFIVKNEKQGKEIKFPQLMAHLVRDHHFFEGNTSYRLEPENAINVLELKSGVDYTPKTKVEIIWRTSSYTTNVNDKFCLTQEIIKNAERQIEIASGAKLYLRENKGVIIAKEDIKLAECLNIDGEEVLLSRNIVRRGQEKIERIEHKYVVG